MDNLAGCPGCMDADRILEGHAYCHPALLKWQKQWDRGKAKVMLENSTWRIHFKSNREERRQT